MIIRKITILAAGSVAGLFALLTGCTQGLTRQQQLWLADGKRHFERKAYRRSIESLTRFLNEVRDQPEIGEASYIRGMSYAQAGDRPAAYADLGRAAAMKTQSDTVWRASVVLGTLYFEDRHWNEAARHFHEALVRMPPEKPRDAVLYRMGLCQERMGRWSAARPYYSELLAKFPRSGFADGARRRLRQNAQNFAVQCGAFRTRAFAERRNAELRQKGLETYIQEVVRGKTPLYVVLAGRYTSYDEAVAAQRAIKRDFVPDAVLWP
jgi:tetratricopeptide (TPR) repeat protein